MLSLSISLLASSPRSSLRAERPVSGIPPAATSSSVLRISLTSELSESELEAVRRPVEPLKLTPDMPCGGGERRRGGSG
jgi:hypothetical protein